MLVLAQGDRVEIAGWEFEVLKLEGRRIDEVRIEAVCAPTEDNTQTATP